MSGRGWSAAGRAGPLAGGAARRRAAPAAPLAPRSRKRPLAARLPPPPRSLGTFDQAMLRLLREPGERWSVYRAWAGELPGLLDLAGLDGLVLTGSSESLDDPPPPGSWQAALLQAVQQADAAGDRILVSGQGGQAAGGAKGWAAGWRAGCWA